MGNAGSIDASKEYVDVVGKGLKKISFRNLDNARIVTLYLRNNQLSSLPVEIGMLTGLKELDLNGNQLTSLPAEIGRLTGLTVLDLRRNQLTSLPVESGMLTGLTTLYLDNNQLTSLPVEIGELTGLERLDLSYNPLTTPPMEVCQEGITAIGAYFLEHQTKARPAKSAAKTMQPVA
jgi:Leucine-rich repeat (LRR) protein